MTEKLSLSAAYDVLRAVGSKDAVVKLSAGAEGADSCATDPLAIFHDGHVARAKLTELNGTSVPKIAELRAALLVIAAEDTIARPKMELSDKDVAYLRLVCDGMNDAACAEHLGLSLRAIKSRKKSVLAGSGCVSLSHAVKRFMREQD